MQDFKSAFNKDIRPQTSDMWLVYQGDGGDKFYQPWQDVALVGTLIDPDTGEDMELVGWTTEDPYV